MNHYEQESNSFGAYVLYIWEKRWWIIAGTIVCMAVTAVYVQFLAHEKFRSFAQVMIKEPLKFLDEEREPMTPVSYEYMLLNDEMILDIRDAFVEETGLRKEGLRLEEFKTAFDIETDVVQDTTLKKEFSPVILLSVDAGKPEHAHLLMKLWLERFMTRYGDLRARHFDYISVYMAEKAEDLTRRLKEKEDEFMNLKWQLPFEIRRLTASELMLAPAPMNWSFDDTRRSYYRFRDESNFDIKMEESLPQSLDKGLERQLIDTEVKLAAAKAAGDTTEASVLEAQRSALQKNIEDKRKEIDTLQKSAAELEKQFEILKREVMTLRDEYQYVVDMKNQADAEASGVRYSMKMAEDSEGVVEHSDLVMLAGPSMPELRVFPKKTITCLAAGMAGFLIMILAVALDKFMKDSRERLEKEQA